MKKKLLCLSMLRVMLLAAGTMLVLASIVAPVSAAGSPVVVTMTDKPARYIPEKITVKVGTTVEFRNTGQVVHDVTTDASIAQDKADVSLPAGAEPFDSGFIAPGQSWSYTFTVPGRYLYACIPHEKDRMVGEVLVTK